jgi:hypothetical protein
MNNIGSFTIIKTLASPRHVDNQRQQSAIIDSDRLDVWREPLAGSCVRHLVAVRVNGVREKDTDILSPISE